MFYSHELLGRRRGKYSTIWLLATAGSRCKWHHVTNKDVVGVDIPRTCADLIHPDTSISLRLASVLLSGLAQALARKSTLLHSECYCTRSRIVSLPWVTGRRGFDPFISSNTTVSSTHLITLPNTYEDVYYPMLSNNDDLLLEITAGGTDGEHVDVSEHLKVWHSFGWRGSSRENPVNISPTIDTGNPYNTQSWSSISLPETQPRQRDSGGLNNAYLGGISPQLDAFSLSAGCGGDLSPNSGSNSVNALDFPLLKREDDERIFFDTDGNLHFASSRESRAYGHSTDDDAHTELFPVDSPGILEHHIGDNISDAEPLHLYSEQIANVKEGSASLVLNNSDRGGANQSNGLIAVVSGNTPEDDTSPTGSVIRHNDNNQEGSKDLWEIIENAVIHNLPFGVFNNRHNPPEPHSPATRQRASRARRGRPEYDNSPDCDTFEARVPGLWGDTCIWDKSQSSEATARVSARIRKQIGHRIAAASRMYTRSGTNVGAGLLVLLYPDLSTSGRHHTPGCDEAAMLVADAFEGNISDDAGGYPLYSDTGPAEEDIELELGRGADRSIELERLAEEEEALNLRMNIPWLDPDIVYSYSARPRASISRPVSIRTESSPAIGVRHSIGSSVGISPSGPDVPSSDPLISDDELDIQQFQLEVGDLVDQGDADSRSITSDMDSFLSAGRAKYSLAHEGASLENIDPELQSFQKFMVARMRDCGKTTIAFSDVIIDPFKTRRVAARAFVDVLQMATMSVFRVSQDKQTSEIRISLI